ncbi:acyltransferase [Alteromonas sp. CYL-A6]|uniref:acyltransferase n=1 Tax=Alteromonas nitratireducens TaxID=3390813 RepID=UPI0034C0CCD2
MANKISLRQYVKRRNGVPLGHNDSMRNMLRRSLGATTFAGFWQYWNPIWSYYLTTRVFQPLKTVLPVPLAQLLTFIVSGAVHDIVISLVAGSAYIVFTPWFFLVGIAVLITNALRCSVSMLSINGRAMTHISLIALCYGFSLLMRDAIAVAAAG